MSNALKNLRFDGRVAIITGSGQGLGKCHALLLAERGASVVINDLGGKPGEKRTADIVVDEINQKGGKAVANYDSVIDGERIVKTALDKFGKVDIIVNNAGIIRDKTFSHMSLEDWELMHQIHGVGTFKTIKAAWEVFRDQKYGRIVNTASIVGLVGNAGQVNYSAAKSSLVGFTRSLAFEGAKYNIKANIILPISGTPMTQKLIPPEIYEQLKPELISPIVAWMCHEEMPDTGMLIESSLGYAKRYDYMRSRGTFLRSDPKGPVTLEAVRDKWPKVIDMNEGELAPHDHLKALANLLEQFKKLKSGTYVDK